MKIKKVSKQSVIKYLMFLLLEIVFASAAIGDLNPFLFALFFASLFVGFNEKFVSVTTVMSALLIQPTLNNFYITITVVGVGLVSFYLHKLIKKNLNIISTDISYLLSLVTLIYYNWFNWQFLVFYVVLGLIALLISIVVLQVVIIRNNCFKLTLDESICFLCFLGVFGLGLSGFDFNYFSVFRLFITFIILLFVAVGSPTLTYAIVLSVSFGAAINSFSLVPIAEFVAVAMFASMFSMPNKFKIGAMTILSDLIIQYLFITPTFEILFELLPITIAVLLFWLFPTKKLHNLSNLVYVKRSEMSSRNVINVTRKNIRRRMADLSNVFLEMKQIHLNMVKKELSKEELIETLSREVMATCCKGCLDKNRCTRALGTENKSNLYTLIDIALSKGRVSLLDIPSSMSNRCIKVNNLIGLINRLCDEYKQYKNVLADVNNVKILLAEQMGAVSRLLLDIGDEIDTNVKFDIAQENKIISRLLSQNIQCREVLLYTEKSEDITAVLIVKGKDSSNPIIEKIVSETLKCSMKISKVMPLEESDFNSVTLTLQSKYDCVFGLSTCNKSGEIECGDCHSIIRLNKNKFLLALCDGMGSGKNAFAMSSATLSLIENFYKVGFDNDIIMDSVNKLLAVNNQESYSTLDICLLDLEKCTADFIKVGAPFGLIKRENAIEAVAGGALPIGALDSISPAVYKTIISVKDVVILATDGITDAFESEENMIEFVSKLATNNPQTIADSILNEALRIYNMSAKDDMTVLVARTYLKN